MSHFTPGRLMGKAVGRRLGRRVRLRRNTSDHLAIGGGGTLDGSRGNWRRRCDQIRTVSGLEPWRAGAGSVAARGQVAVDSRLA